jgi:hypothetical protein
MLEDNGSLSRNSQCLRLLAPAQHLFVSSNENVQP